MTAWTGLATMTWHLAMGARGLVTWQRDMTRQRVSLGKGEGERVGEKVEVRGGWGPVGQRHWGKMRTATMILSSWGASLRSTPYSTPHGKREATARARTGARGRGRGMGSRRGLGCGRRTVAQRAKGTGVCGATTSVGVAMDTTHPKGVATALLSHATPLAVPKQVCHAPGLGCTDKTPLCKGPLGQRGRKKWGRTK